MTTAARVPAGAVLYARVSSKDQEREGFSIPAQQKLLRHYACEHGLTVLKEFVDIETAKQAGRADWIARGVRDSQSKLEQTRQQALAEATQRRRSVQAKLDRAYTDDYLEGRISGAFWTRKCEEWEADLATIDAELARLSRPTPAYAATAERILELAKTAHSLYLEQPNVDRRRILD